MRLSDTSRQTQFASLSCPRRHKFHISFSESCKTFVTLLYIVYSLQSSCPQRPVNLSHATPVLAMIDLRPHLRHFESCWESSLLSSWTRDVLSFWTAEGLLICTRRMMRIVPMCLLSMFAQNSHSAAWVRLGFASCCFLMQLATHLGVCRYEKKEETDCLSLLSGFSGYQVWRGHHLSMHAGVFWLAIAKNFLGHLEVNVRIVERHGRFQHRKPSVKKVSSEWCHHNQYASTVDPICTRPLFLPFTITLATLACWSLLGFAMMDIEKLYCRPISEHLWWHKFHFISLHHRRHLQQH